MKALKRKRGRPKLTVIRQPNGQPSRAKNPPSKLALEVRARMHKISVEAAHDQQAGVWLGRLHMTYQRWSKIERQQDKPQPPQSISTGQYYALLSYQVLHNDHLKAIGAPGAHFEVTGGHSSGGNDDATAKWRANIKARYNAAREAIQAAQNHDQGNLWAALDHCIIQEQQMPHMIGDVRTLGNTLANHFNGVDRRGKSH